VTHKDWLLPRFVGLFFLGRRLSFAMLELKEVSKTYGTTAALEKLSLVLEPQKTTVLIGPSGCGKSTLLRLMIGLITPDSGTVVFNGTPITSQTSPKLRQEIGYVIQDGGLFPHLTAKDNVVLMARFLGWNQNRIDKRVAELAELVQLPISDLERYPVQLSGGQRQRVSLMRGLMLDPNALLLDEPLGALDPIIRSELQNDLRRIFQTLEKTAVLVTHDLGEAAFFGDSIVLLRSGRIVQQGTLEDMLQHPADPFVTRFINAQRSKVDALGGVAP
jgi:osmoprotectant transport system ATP-binding protein